MGPVEEVTSSFKEIYSGIQRVDKERKKPTPTPEVQEEETYNTYQYTVAEYNSIIDNGYVRSLVPLNQVTTYPVTENENDYEWKGEDYYNKESDI